MTNLYLVYVRQVNTNYVRSRKMRLNDVLLSDLKSKIGKITNGFEVVKIEPIYK